MSISSHITLPEVVLHNFESVNGAPFYWIDYGSAPQYRIKRAHAASFNTEEDYYTAEVEAYFSKNVENHINSLLWKAPGINDEIINLDEVFRDEAFSYLEMLFSRDPTFHIELEKTPSEIVMFITPKLKEDDTIRNRFQKVSYLINQSNVPFTLPSNGIIQLNNKLICPISPQVALFFYDTTEDYFSDIDEDDYVMEINRIAFKQALCHKCTALICSKKRVLNTLREEYLKGKQQNGNCF